MVFSLSSEFDLYSSGSELYSNNHQFVFHTVDNGISPIRRALYQESSSVSQEDLSEISISKVLISAFSSADSKTFSDTRLDHILSPLCSEEDKLLWAISTLENLLKEYKTDHPSSLIEPISMTPDELKQAVDVVTALSCLYSIRLSMALKCGISLPSNESLEGLKGKILGLMIPRDIAHLYELCHGEKLARKTAESLIKIYFVRQKHMHEHWKIYPNVVYNELIKRPEQNKVLENALLKLATVSIQKTNIREKKKAIGYCYIAANEFNSTKARFNLGAFTYADLVEKLSKKIENPKEFFANPKNLKPILYLEAAVKDFSPEFKYDRETAVKRLRNLYIKIADSLRSYGLNAEASRVNELTLKGQTAYQNYEQAFKGQV